MTEPTKLRELLAAAIDPDAMGGGICAFRRQRQEAARMAADNMLVASPIADLIGALDAAIAFLRTGTCPAPWTLETIEAVAAQGKV